MKAPNTNFISFNKRNFGRNNSKGLLILNSMLILLGVLGFFLNWKNGVCAIIVIAIAYLLKKSIYLKDSIIIITAIILISGLSYFLSLSFPEIFFTTLFLSFSFFLKSNLVEIKENNEFEFFFLDHKKLKCLVTEDNDYKGYALNPKAYLKTYKTESIRSFTFKRKHLLISIGSEITSPRELTVENLNDIRLFVKNNFPHLLENEIAFNENLKIEDKFYINKFLISSPFIIFPTLIYLFADNGIDTGLSFLFIVLMFVLPFIIHRIVRQK